jgi:putative transposase
MRIAKYGDHRPVHIYKGETYYFVSSSTFNKQPIINSDGKKQYLKELLADKARIFSVGIKAWVIMDNHYHLLFKLRDEDTLSKFIGGINGASSRYFNKMDNISNRRVWYKGKYWDRCIRSEKDFWTRFNYIHNNPIKHGFVPSIDELDQYKFSSWNYYKEKYGREWLSSVLKEYPVIDFTVSGIE